ncbi:hypothetical protein AVEN_47591-1 [Araneus ventricosus]|uniref:Uncharacterized protein n=1 Tax=Araneus ventricosus TaxID=182803 RepID=A0A4Y2DLV5_ARAVE|nr:hypothetical protein AVEN_47591-1 [Araneus ventricosus]
MRLSFPRGRHWQIRLNWFSHLPTLDLDGAFQQKRKDPLPLCRANAETSLNVESVFVFLLGTEITKKYAYPLSKTTRVLVWDRLLPTLKKWCKCHALEARKGPQSKVKVACSTYNVEAHHSKEWFGYPRTWFRSNIKGNRYVHKYNGLFTE